MDLLGNGTLDSASSKQILEEVCRVPVPDDGLVFDTSQIAVEPVRQDAEYDGHRVKFEAQLAAARIPIQIDIGLGDAVTPAPYEAEYPAMLDFPSPRLLVYPRETVVAEKFQAMVMLGMTNSRIKDFYDLWTLAKSFDFDGGTLSAAIAATFSRRRTAMPSDVPIGLTKEFWDDGAKWRAFLNRNKLVSTDADVSAVIVLLRRFLLPPVQALRADLAFQSAWTPATGWRE